MQLGHQTHVPTEPYPSDLVIWPCLHTPSSLSLWSGDEFLPLSLNIGVLSPPIVYMNSDKKTRLASVDLAAL